MEEGYVVSEENYNFQKLTPVNDAELSIYKDALDFIFSPVAITKKIDSVLSIKNIWV